MPIGKSQIALIHVAKAKLGLDEDSYRAILRNVTGCNSSKQLDNDGFTALMQHFEKLGFRSTSEHQPIGRRWDMATDAQISKMRALWASYTGGEGNDKSLGRWLEGRFKVSSLRFVTAELAPKAIAALTRMAAKRGAPAG